MIQPEKNLNRGLLGNCMDYLFMTTNLQAQWITSGKRMSFWTRQSSKSLFLAEVLLDQVQMGHRSQGPHQLTPKSTSHLCQILWNLSRGIAPHLLLWKSWIKLKVFHNKIRIWQLGQSYPDYWSLLRALLTTRFIHFKTLSVVLLQGKAIYCTLFQLPFWLKKFQVENMRSDITYRFSIVNFSKPDSLYNYGMKPGNNFDWKIIYHMKYWF